MGFEPVISSAKKQRTAYADLIIFTGLRTMVCAKISLDFFFTASQTVQNAKAVFAF